MDIWTKRFCIAQYTHTPPPGTHDIHTRSTIFTIWHTKLFDNFLFCLFEHVTHRLDNIVWMLRIFYGYCERKSDKNFISFIVLIVMSSFIFIKILTEFIPRINWTSFYRSRSFLDTEGGRILVWLWLQYQLVPSYRRLTSLIIIFGL